MSTNLTTATAFAFDLIEKKKFSAHVHMFSDLLFASHFDQKLLRIVKESSSFTLMSDLVGKLDLLFSLVFVQILYRAEVL